jgi:pseudaminic acid biosynthesis-associated methylase
MREQLEQWTGEFGRAYTERNVFDWKLRVPAFRKMVEGLSLAGVLEVGCNRGFNLLALREVLGDGPEFVGIEPNAEAVAIARAAAPKITALQGAAYDLPFKDASFDLGFTSGVLIHIPARDLPRALAEIHRVSRRYVLAVECFAATETVVPYRGSTELMWKRDFLAAYQAQFPGLKLIGHGFWGAEYWFDDAHWWLLEKPAA